MSAFVDTNVLLRHLTGDPTDIAARATAYLARATTYLESEPQLFLTDLVVAETVYVPESFYEAPRAQVAEAARSLLALPSVVSVDAALLLRALEVSMSPCRSPQTRHPRGRTPPRGPASPSIAFRQAPNAGCSTVSQARQRHGDPRQ